METCAFRAKLQLVSIEKMYLTSELPTLLLLYLPPDFAPADTEDADPSEDSCPICLCEYEVGDAVRMLPCAHSFHLRCIDTWLARDTSCPMCKRCVLEGCSTGGMGEEARTLAATVLARRATRRNTRTAMASANAVVPLHDNVNMGGPQLVVSPQRASAWGGSFPVMSDSSPRATGADTPASHSTPTFAPPPLSSLQMAIMPRGRQAMRPTAQSSMSTIAAQEVALDNDEREAGAASSIDGSTHRQPLSTSPPLPASPGSNTNFTGRDNVHPQHLGSPSNSVLPEMGATTWPHIDALAWNPSRLPSLMLSQGTTNPRPSHVIDISVRRQEEAMQASRDMNLPGGVELQGIGQ